MAREDQIRRKRVESSKQSAHSMKYEKGDRVFIKIPKKPGQPGKLQSRWDGPFIVICSRQGNTYRVKREDDFRKRYIRHHDQMKPFQTREDRLQGSEQTTEGQENRTVEEPRIPGGPNSDTRVTLPQDDRSEAGSNSETDTQEEEEEEEEEEEGGGGTRRGWESPATVSTPNRGAATDAPETGKRAPSAGLVR